MERIEKDYEELLKLFGKHRVRYCVVGGYAVAFHSIPRYTKDMDIFVKAASENAERILRALREFGFSSLKISKKDFCKPGGIIQLGYEPVRIDLVTSIDGCDFDGVWERKEVGKYGRTKVYFIGLKDLIRNKEACNRTQDMADLEALK
ncbi:MAG: nucleotidyltransferase [Candidatus Omnitrophica bacterium]|nr:nucleotidyltransferase [Candidatus Omnitrophota bacterium]